MLRLNRGRVIGGLLTVFVIYFLFLSSDTNGDFRRRTEEGLSRRHGVLQGDLSDEVFQAQTNQKLSEILAQKNDREGDHRPLRASDEGTGPAYKDVVDDEVTGVAGRKTMQKPKYPVGAKVDEQQDSLKAPLSDEDEDVKKTKASADPGKDFAREKLQEFLKKPLVIFSKSYCPHSKRAKQLLLDLYKITPAPLVVELDQLTEHVPTAASSSTDEDEHQSRAPTLGQKIQELLAEISGRRTVPNIMVGGTTSIGGNDLIWEMHSQGTLADKIKELGGKRITSVELAQQNGDEDSGHRKRR